MELCRKPRSSFGTFCKVAKVLVRPSEAVPRSSLELDQIRILTNPIQSLRWRNFRIATLEFEEIDSGTLNAAAVSDALTQNVSTARVDAWLRQKSRDNGLWRSKARLMLAKPDACPAFQIPAISFFL